jgi:GNAT superfamily N-acetyltransferase
MAAHSLLQATATFPGVEIFALPPSPASPLAAPFSAAFASLVRAFQHELASLGVALSAFQALEEELAALPGRYAPAAQGGLWLACIAHAHGGQDGASSAALARHPTVTLGCRGAFAVIGCLAARDLGEGVGELKRMFVAAPYRGGGVGGALLRQALAWARAEGRWRALVLDTLGRLPSATRLYERSGFQRTGAYCENPLPDAIYLRLELPVDAPGDAASVK